VTGPTPEASETIDSVTAAQVAWAGVVANRRAGAGRGRRAVARLEVLVNRLGWGTRVAWTPEERTRLVREANHAPGCRGLVAVGGDGTVASLVNERPAVPIAVLPSGTENLFARHCGLGRTPEAVVAALAAGRSRPIDLGVADGRRFALMAGLGFDGDVVSAHHRVRLGEGGQVRTTSRLAYVLPILRSSVTYRFPPMRVRVEDPGPPEQVEGTTVFVFNLARYALGLPFVPDARDDDGLLDLLVFREPGPFRAFRYLVDVFLRRHLGRPGVLHRRVRRVTIEADAAVPVQLDGDPGGVLGPGRPWTVEVEPSALRIVTPGAGEGRR
jgi:diacylglycerol kinase family enzyme